MGSNTEHPRVLIAGAWSGDAEWIAELARRAAADSLDTMIITGDLRNGPCPDRADDIETLVEAVSAHTGARVTFLDALDGERPASTWRRYAQVGAFVILQDQIVWMPRSHVWQFHGRTFGSLAGAAPTAADSATLSTPLDVLLTHASAGDAVVRSVLGATRPRLHVHGNVHYAQAPYVHSAGDITEVHVLPGPQQPGSAILLDLDDMTATPYPAPRP